MNKSMKPSAPISKGKEVPELTPEEEKQNYIKAYMQKKSSLAEGILFNLVQGNAHLVESIKPEEIAKFANETATAFLKEVYNLELTIKEDEE